MRRQERINDETVAFLSAFRGQQATLWTALPGIIKSFNPAMGTAEVQPAIQAKFTSRDGVSQWVTLPLLVDCPVVFPAGGGFTLTFPVTDGDECLVVFASRCIDAWWQSGGVQAQVELRMHDLSDGFVIPGGRSVPKVVTGISTSDVVLRNDAGTSKVSIKANGDIDFVTPTRVTMSAPEVDVTATVNITGAVNIAGDLAISGAVTNVGVNIGKTHHHVPDSRGDTQGIVAP